MSRAGGSNPTEGADGHASSIEPRPPAETTARHRPGTVSVITYLSKSRNGGTGVNSKLDGDRTSGPGAP